VPAPSNEVYDRAENIEINSNTEFGAQFSLAGTSGTAEAQVLVDVTVEGKIDVTQTLFAGTSMPVASLGGTITLSSTLFKGATGVVNLRVPARSLAEVMRAGSAGEPLVLEDMEGAAHTATEDREPSAPLTQLKSESASLQVVPPPARAQQAWGDLTASVDGGSGIVLVAIPPGTWPGVIPEPNSTGLQSFQVVSECVSE